MAGLVTSNFTNIIGRLMPRRLRALAGTAWSAVGQPIGGRTVAAGISLSLAAAGPGIALTALSGLPGLIGPPASASFLIALLLLAPTAVALAAVLCGLPRIAGSHSQGQHELEQAVFRILVMTLLFGHAATLGTENTQGHGAAVPLLVAAAGLIAGWCLLLSIVLRPVPSTIRRQCGMAMDCAVLSGFLCAGGAATAGWYSLYLVATLYAGFRFGVGALTRSAAVGLAGFSAVVASSPFWHEQPALAGGMALALAAVPALAALPIRSLAEARAGVAAERAARARLVETLAGRLQHVPEPAAAPDIDDILDLAAIEAGIFAPQNEAFDLHALVDDALVAARPRAAERGVAIRLRIDPALPYRLVGWREPFDRVLRNLLGFAIERTEAKPVRLALAALACDRRRVRLRLTLDCRADPAIVPSTDPLAEGGSAENASFGLALARRIVEHMEGCIGIGIAAGGQTRFTVELVLAVDLEARETELDLAGRAVLIVTGDGQFAGEITEFLEASAADARWIGEGEQALDYIAQLGPAAAPILLIDGRSRPLSATAFADRAALIGGPDFSVVSVAEPSHIAGLSELEDGEFDALLPSPIDPQLLLNALHALRTSAVRVRAEAAAWASPAGTGSPAHDAIDDRVTPIAAHPRFAGETGSALDPQPLEALQELGEAGLLGEIVETFCPEAEQIMRRLARATAAGDVAAFVHDLRALHRAAGPLGGSRLCQLALSLHGLTAAELRDQGEVHLQRLSNEIETFARELQNHLGEVAARRR